MMTTPLPTTILYISPSCPKPVPHPHLIKRLNPNQLMGLKSPAPEGYQ